MSACSPASLSALSRTGWVVVLVCSVLMAWRAATATAPAADRQATPAERAALSAEAAILEPRWERAAQRAYPGDLWSQSDDFHGREKRWAQAVARRLKIRVDDVLGAIDEGLRSQTGDTSGGRRRRGVSPCKPRPFYD